jgi:hypothetical protein
MDQVVAINTPPGLRSDTRAALRFSRVPVCITPITLAPLPYRMHRDAGIMQPGVSLVNEYLARIGREGGLKGGKARAERLPANKRRAIARKAAKAR